MGKYFDELKRAMEFLDSIPNSMFLGQAVGCPGTGMSNTLADCQQDKKLELPVFEDTQMGMSIGLALGGFLPISIYPRWNFLLLATNQLVNHLDKIPQYSAYTPKVIIRTSIGSQRPLHPQHQHVGDYTEAFKRMMTYVDVVRLDHTEDIFPAYEWATRNPRSTILVEWGDYYNEK
jgi:pyruvate/2-oxoglutarate/acetoin dehydrogenase E1 component